ncbi:MAG: pilus assembly protein [Pararhodobacter sp.]|nr:pilus assembly protein [Pararhodobacter sp.]
MERAANEISAKVSLMIWLPLARWLQRAVRFVRDQHGLAAIEFALVGPIAVFGLVAMADIGLAVRDRMALDHIVRTGAQTAVANPGTDAVLNALHAASEGSLTRAGSVAALSVSVVQECACPEAPANSIACTTTCSGQKPTFIFYTLRADSVASGLLLPDMAVSSRARVQVR